MRHKVTSSIAANQRPKSRKVRLATLSRRWTKKTRILIAGIVDIFADFSGAMSTRQVYYQCVSRGLIDNNSRDYNRIQRLVVEMRRAGLIGYDRVVDRTRTKHHRRGWDGIDDLMRNATLQYRRDYWAEQDLLPVVAIEKQALEGVFAEMVDVYGTPLWVLRGYASEAFAYEWAQEIRSSVAAGKTVRIYYFGDHDPSGLSIETDATRKLREFGAKFEWERRGLLIKDFEEFDLINVPVKASDTRSAKYLERYGDQAAELDALPPQALEARIRDAIEGCIDCASWERVRIAERAQKESLTLVSENWNAALSAALREVG